MDARAPAALNRGSYESKKPPDLSEGFMLVANAAYFFFFAAFFFAAFFLPPFLVAFFAVAFFAEATRRLLGRRLPRLPAARLPFFDFLSPFPIF